MITPRLTGDNGRKKALLLPVGFMLCNPFVLCDGFCHFSKYARCTSTHTLGDNRLLYQSSTRSTYLPEFAFRQIIRSERQYQCH